MLFTPAAKTHKSRGAKMKCELPLPLLLLLLVLLLVLLLLLLAAVAVAVVAYKMKLKTNEVQCVAQQLFLCPAQYANLQVETEIDFQSTVTQLAGK